jgi:tetratricopeptide (TPR) repeat protein/nucleotide-binding universal stress UspA family protein
MRCSEKPQCTGVRCSAYNFPDVTKFFRFRAHAVGRIFAAAALTSFFAAFAAVAAGGQATADFADANGTGAKVLLVLPFDNRTGLPSLEWIREAAADVLSTRFASAGFQPTSRADRMYALDHLGLPQGFQPSRASSLKLAQTLDADSIVVGSYTTDGSGILAEARLVNVPELRMTPTVTARGEMRDMIAVFGTLAWKLTKQLDPKFNGTEETFAAAGRGIPLNAYEQYIRGITEPDQAERVKHLQEAVQLSPDFGPAWMALGREDYRDQQYPEAAAAFAKVDHTGPDGLSPQQPVNGLAGGPDLEAGFYRGLSLMFSGNYPQAEQAFADVARVLPLAEVLNNEAVAASRQGHDGTSLFIQAAAADPNGADYHFNLAVTLKRHGNTAGAENELAQCLKLRPNDSEALSLAEAWKRPANADASADPLERIARNFDAAAFRQAAAMLDQVNAGRLAALSPQDRVLALCLRARDYLNRGLLLEAERLYQDAAQSDTKSAEAHAGLAEVRERSGDADAARKEAQAALELDPTNQTAQSVLREIAAKTGK